MHRVRMARTLGVALLGVLLAVGLLAGSGVVADPQIQHTSKPFMGPKANKGTVAHATQGGKQVLTLSDDFVVPDTPDPHWQVVDSKGTVYLLHRLKIKEDKYNKSITLPSYIKDVAKVQIWCAWAETNLGEASFEKPVM